MTRSCDRSAERVLVLNVSHGQQERACARDPGRSSMGRSRWLNRRGRAGNVAAMEKAKKAAIRDTICVALWLLVVLLLVFISATEMGRSVSGGFQDTTAVINQR